MAKLIIAGGTGWLGSAIIRHYSNADHEIVVLTRSTKEGSHNLRYVYWDGRSLGEWDKELEGADAVINLAGSSINTRFTTHNKYKIRQSRIHATAVIGEAIRATKNPPQSFGSTLLEFPYLSPQILSGTKGMRHREGISLPRYPESGKRLLTRKTHRIPAG